MDIKTSHCFIAVDDHDKALAFYHEVLGLEVRNDVSFEGMRWVTVGRRPSPTVTSSSNRRCADPNASPADRQALAELLAKGLLRGVIFATDDCDATFERIRASGAEVLQEPMDQPYGVRGLRVPRPGRQHAAVQPAEAGPGPGPAATRLAPAGR